MRNLKNIRRSVLADPRFEPERPLTALAWDTSAQDTLICAFGPTKDNGLVELKRFNAYADSLAQHQLIASWDAPCPNPGLPCDQILDLHYFADTAVACLVFASGDIVVIREQPLPGDELLEIVGSVAAGISAAAWSPDEELLAISTKDQSFLLMSRDFESVADVPFTADDAKLSKHVSVGWGKVETQFKGKRAKALRDPTIPEKVDEGLLSEHDQGEVNISWRGDGNFVAVNSIEGKTRRMIRVYSRDGVLDSVSEPVDYLEGALSWRPAGNLISGIQRLEDRILVVFFERNGLRHGEFELRFSKNDLNTLTYGPTVGLKWNVDSTVLAVIFNGSVQLWTMGNFHYYLKQELWRGALEGDEKRPCKPHNPLKLCWHPEHPLSIATYGTHGFHSREYTFSVSKGPTTSPFDEGLVAVIDGMTVKITPLRIANVPPPMALYEIEVKANVVDVALSTSGRYLAVLTHYYLALYDMREVSSRGRATKPIVEHEFGLRHEGRTYLQVAFYTDTALVLMSHFEKQNSEIFEQIALHFDDEEKDVIYGCKQMLEDSDNRVSLLISGQSIPNILVEHRRGTISELRDDSENPADSIGSRHQLHPIAQLPVACPSVEVVQLHGSVIAFGLSSNGQLFANSRRLVSNCTSFLLTSSHLIFTTSNHLLKFVHMAPVDHLEVPADEPETDERCRSIERGAKLVTVMPSAYSLVLQMPRGNLETIYPRALVLAAIRKNITERDYKKAFLTCRSQRVDMNILYDYSPQQFLKNVELFIKQVKKVEHIDLFLSQLREENTAQTIYPDTLRETTSRDREAQVSGDTEISTEQDISTAKSKVNAICDAFLRVLSRKLDTNLQNIITAHVCKTPPDLEGGLKIVAQLRGQGDDLAERAAEHICFLADVNQLYDHALGMYDLELTVLIAQQSQKDPREYLPYLQGLQEMELLRRQFTIDNDLGKKEKALRHLHALDSFDELKRYVEKHELYAAAIDLCKYQPERFNSLMRSYADYLSSCNRFKDAGIAYEYLHDYSSAITQYRSANLWSEALSCASLLPLPPKEFLSLARDLADGLTESKDYASAANIHLDYLSDIESAARLFCKAYRFAEAMRIIALKSQPELLTEVIDPGIIEAFNSTTELLADCKAQLSAQVPRLAELRLRKQTDPLAFYGGETAGGEDGEVPDDISLAPTDTSTTGTFMTRYTKRTDGTVASNVSRRSSKNRRREERKRARGKKGSVYEEEYLVNSIGRLIERVNSVGDDVHKLVEALMRRGMREQSVNVERVMVEIVRKCKEVVPEVWKVEKKIDEEQGLSRAEDVTWEATATAVNLQPPAVKDFEKLSLLG